METTRTKFSGQVSTLISDVMDLLRKALTRLGGEYNLNYNEYGFCSAWLENDVEVWWDKTADAPHMDELTELCALYETICKTEEEINQ